MHLCLTCLPPVLVFPPSFTFTVHIFYVQSEIQSLHFIAVGVCGMIHTQSLTGSMVGRGVQKMLSSFTHRRCQTLRGIILVGTPLPSPLPLLLPSLRPLHSLWWPTQMEPVGITISCSSEGGGRELERRESEPLPVATAGSIRVTVLCGGQIGRDGMP